MANIGDVDSSSFTRAQAKESTAGSFAGVTAGTDSTTGQSVIGLYGTLTVGANGSYAYSVSQINDTVQALTEVQSLNDVFVVKVSDGAGGTVDQTLTITIDGTNDAPTTSGAITNTQANETGVNPDGTPQNEWFAGQYRVRHEMKAAQVAARQGADADGRAADGRKGCRMGPDLEGRGR